MDNTDSLSYMDMEPLLLPQDAITDKRDWHRIEQSRRNFLACPSESFASDLVRPEILESWVRSYTYDVDPDGSWLCLKITDQEYQQVYDAYEYLIDIAKPMMQMLNDLQLSADYIFELMGLNGVSLYQFGNLKLHQHIAAKSIFNEATMGTNSHSLCMRHRRPFIVIGPEHYCSALHSLTACAVPIFDENGDVIASLLFTRTNPSTPWSKSYHKLLSHTVGLITSIAAAIESRLYYKHCFTHMRVLQDKVSKFREHDALVGRSGSAFKEDVIVAATPNLADKTAQWAAAHNGEQASIRFDDIIYKSDKMADAVELAKRFAKADENILITGESGTGKEYFAQAIHNYSSSQGPFMSINCAAIPHRLIESELFGYEPGTFTGAQRSGKAGKIELAHGGTLFLDEIGDMPLELQATLLRVLENKLVMRLGGKSYKKVDFRVVAATNRNLMTMVADGLFREDLFYRLSILTIGLPPLRERQDDLCRFIQHFLDESQRRGYGGSGQQRRFSPDAIKLLTSYSWPGNVRQLRNAVVSTYYASQDLVIGTQDLPAYLQNPVIDAQNMMDNSGTASLSKLEEMAIKTVLERTGYNVAQTAKQLGVSKATLYRKLKEYNLLMARRS